MGACSSVPKAMREEATAFPPSEPPKEETPATEAPPAVAVDKEEGGEEKKVVEESDANQSLGTLLVEGEAEKEKESTEPKAEALPVSEPAGGPGEEKPTEAAPPAAVVAAA
ncbi:hypothetical protein CDL12_21297 [Handroanthus impetiginosus]|uniref:Uncharacterized protein n=1 Tax=Handroanthus impetiginosus TaxID=429701 RepID=A0A2G9GLH1_9LAMI|nr:hypothetical protein CDL12_21297 [Handroanthus impetiginosus]